MSATSLRSASTLSPSCFLVSLVASWSASVSAGIKEAVNLSNSANSVEKRAGKGEGEGTS